MVTTLPSLSRALLILSAALLVGSPGAAAPIQVVYEITGGSSIGAFDDLAGGQITVTFPNPSNLSPPLTTADPQVQYQLTTVYGSTIGRTLNLAFYTAIFAYRGVGKTLTARLSFQSDSTHGSFFRRFRLTAGSNGMFVNGRLTTRDTLDSSGWLNITGHEIASVPEPGHLFGASVAALILSSVAAGALLVRQRDRRRSLDPR